MDPLLYYLLYQVFIAILAIEIGVLFFFVLAVIVERIASSYLSNKSCEKKKKITFILNSHLENKTLYNPKKKYKDFNDHSNLLSIMEAFNHRINEADWEMLKKAVASRYLLPKARKWMTSFFWIKRNFAARCFALEPLIEDEKSILSLIDDPIFLVRSLASHAAIQLDSKEGIMKTLLHMSQETGYAHYRYRDILLHGSKNAFLWIEEIAEKKKRTSIHLACLEVLAGTTITLPLPFLEDDLASKNSNVRLATLKVLNRHPQKNSEKILFKCLKDPEEDVRAEAAIGLENFSSEETLKQLKIALKDSSIKVRLQAGTTLKKFGEVGREILMHQDEKQSRDIAKYVLEFCD